MNNYVKIRIRQVQRRTTLLLARFRYHIRSRRGNEEKSLLSEEVLAHAFAGSPQEAEWLPDEFAEKLLLAKPDANINPAQATRFVQRVIDGFSYLKPHLESTAKQRAEVLLDAHRRVRTAARMRGVRYLVQPQLPPDVLGIFIFLPFLP